MKLKKMFRSLQGYKDLKVVATVGNYVVVANLKGQIVGIMNKADAPATPEFIGKVTSNTIPVIFVTPASYKYGLTVIPVFQDKQQNNCWCSIKDSEEIAIIDGYKPQWTGVAVAANYDCQIYFRVIKEL